MKKPLTVLILADELNIGGVETYVLSLGTELQKNDIRVIVGTSGGPMLDVYKDAGLEVVFFHFGSDDPVGNEYLNLLSEIRDFVLKEKVDIIHAHFIAGIKVAGQINNELGVPAVVTVHGMYYPILKMKRLLAHIPRVIAVSEPVREWLTGQIGYPSTQVSVIPNGIDQTIYTRAENAPLRIKLGIPDDTKLVVLCTRIAWDKTWVVENAIYAVEQLSEHFNIKLIVVGGGMNSPLIHATANMVNRRSGQELASIAGWQLNPAKFYQSADLVIGTGRVALEALSCQKPVIVAGNAGYVGILKPDNLYSAWRLYFGDHKSVDMITPKKLFTDMGWLLENPLKSQRYAKEAYEWVTENFAVSCVASQIIEFYQALLAKRTPKLKQIVGEVHGGFKTENGQTLPLASKEELAEVKPLVSIAIPTFNRAEFLAECLDSVAVQTYRPLEIVVVNDGSTDGTEEVALKWWKNLKDKTELTFVYHRLPGNRGCAAAQSIAYYLSTGQYIANLDSDDISHPNRIESQLRFLLANDEYSLVGTTFRWFSQDVGKSHRSYMVKYGFKNIRKHYQKGGHCVCFGTLLFKRAVFNRIGGLTEHIPGSEDYDWVARALNAGFYVDSLREELYFYRSHQGQRSRAKRKRGQSRKNAHQQTTPSKPTVDMGEYVLGVDGGASKTLCYVADTSGITLGKGRSGCANMTLVGFESASTQVRLAVLAALEDAQVVAEQVKCAHYGLAGVSSKNTSEWRAHLSFLTPNSIVVVENDVYLPIRQACPEGYGIGVVSGTRGNIGIIRKDGTRFDLDGRVGFSAGYLGKKALARAIEEIAAQEISEFTERLIHNSDFDSPEHFSVALRQQPKVMVNKINQIISRLAIEGVPGARRIAIAFLNRVFKDLDTFMRKQSVDKNATVAFGGAVLSSLSPLIYELWNKRLEGMAESPKLVVIDVDPVEAAVQGALQASIASEEERCHG